MTKPEKILYTLSKPADLRKINMAVEGIHPYVFEPGIRTGFTAAGLPIVSPSFHPAESASSQPTAATPTPADPLRPPSAPIAPTPYFSLNISFSKKTIAMRIVISI